MDYNRQRSLFLPRSGRVYGFPDYGRSVIGSSVNRFMDGLLRSGGQFVAQVVSDVLDDGRSVIERLNFSKNFEKENNVLLQATSAFPLLERDQCIWSFCQTTLRSINH
ncbi:hypothetical protein NPIL_282491 [Nephila pilipes]|uniref:Uncharacterized protein n=1 Tax=Nephila pilipes TaxID=299642 RepID=A0A8X6N0K0_NEPPI|nr:hypothetical protein NPIL_282491 [Nephila pilipes]